MSQPKSGMFVTPDGRSVGFTFFLLVLLFTLWGFCNGMIDVMDKHFQKELHLSLSQSAWVQTAHYLGYLIMGIPAGWLATRLGYRGGIITGLLIVAVGGFWFIPATHIHAFWAFLLGVCIIAAGLTFLETVANPYTTVLGSLEYAATRINLAQSLNGVGLVFGPIVGAKFFYSENAQGVSTGSETLWIPYAAIACIVIVLAIVFAFARMPEIRMEDDYHLDAPGAGRGPVRHFWSQPHFYVAVLAQFLYVAAQAGVWSFFVNYMTSQTPSIPASWVTGLEHFQAGIPSWLGGWLGGWFKAQPDGGTLFSDKGASTLASVAFLFFVAGRFTGSGILKKASAHRVLGVYGGTCTLLCLLVFLKLGWLSVACVFFSYFFMSIIFPTIFALGIFGLGEQAKKASSFLVMAIFGGAVLPKLMGMVADHSDLSRGFIVPLVCFAVVALYGFLWPRLSGHAGMQGVNTSRSH